MVEKHPKKEHVNNNKKVNLWKNQTTGRQCQKI